jgi:ribosomal protein L35AE/L33A
LPEVAIVGSVAKRTGTVDRLKGETSAVGTHGEIVAAGLFTTADEVAECIGKNVVVVGREDETPGELTAAFGKQGKVRVIFSAQTAAKIGDTVEIRA